MEQKINLKQMVDRLFQGKKTSKIIFIIGIIGILLIFLSSVIPHKTNNSSATSTQETITSEEYTSNLETKLTELAEGINGVGKAKVMVTLENGIEYVYANSQKKSNDNTQDFDEGANKKSTDKNTLEQDVTVIDGKDGKQALVVTELEPTVKGVVVVCEGGGDIKVVENLTNAVTTALNISSTRVSVIQSATIS